MKYTSMTYSPLPKWKVLLQSIFFPNKIDRHDLSRSWVEKKDNYFWLSRSAWSLYLIAKFRIKATGKKNIVVWCPDYFCNSSLAPLRELGVQLKFYQIQEDVNPNIESCLELMKEAKPDLIIAVHYFGKPAELSGLQNISSEIGAWLIEDSAHVAIPVKKIGTYGDFILYSPYKSLPIPDGALLIVRNLGPCKITREMIDNNGLSDLYRILIDSNNSNILRVMLWLIKRIIQKLGIYKLPINTSFDNDGLVVNTKRFIRPRMSLLSKRMLANMLKQIKNDFNIKITNQKLWEEYISSNDIGNNNIDISSINEYIPYLYALVHKSKASAEKTFSELSNNRLPVLTWPDLPPEVRCAPGVHNVAIFLRESRVFLPLHDSLNPCLKV